MEEPTLDRLPDLLMEGCRAAVAKERERIRVIRISLEHACSLVTRLTREEEEEGDRGSSSSSRAQQPKKRRREDSSEEEVEESLRQQQPQPKSLAESSRLSAERSRRDALALQQDAAERRLERAIALSRAASDALSLHTAASPPIVWRPAKHTESTRSLLSEQQRRDLPALWEELNSLEAGQA